MRFIFAVLKTIFGKIFAFLGPVANSIKGKINLDEFVRIVTLAFTTGGSLYGVLSIIYQDVSLFVTDATLAKEISLSVSILTFVLDYIRRRNHGKDPK